MVEPERRHLMDLKAVALRYQPEADRAPTVAASGRGHMAQKIIDLARGAGVPIRRDADLVQVLSKLDVNQEIPPDLYQAVAEILAFIYQQSQKRKG